MSNDSVTFLQRAAAALTSPRVVRAHIAATSALCILAAATLLRSAYSGFAWGKFDLFDYGIYTNMVWNCGRGQLFRFLMDQSYLRVHLSFTLALLGPLFYIWDHPFLLSLLQWLMLLGGGTIAWMAGRRHGLPMPASLAVACFLLLYPFTQTVILCEFHGVGLYLLLLPWLYYCLSTKSNWAWLPLALTVGVREDAFLAILPVLAYFTVKHRSKAIGLMLAAAILYGLLAVYWIYPAINGQSLFAARAGYLPRSGPAAIFEGKALSRRARALSCVFIPALLLMRRGWLPILTFVSVPLAAAIAASSRFQYELKMHYPAGVMACLALGVLEAFILSHKRNRTSPAITHAHAACLVLITLAMHGWRGYLPLGGKHKAEYSGPGGKAAAVLDACRHIPRQGLLMCSNRQAVFCANRADIDVWEPRYSLPKHAQREPDLALFRLKDIRSAKAAKWLPGLTNNTFDVIYTNESYAVFAKRPQPDS